jgi:AcrR family transcriptional regulator
MPKIVKDEIIYMAVMQVVSERGYAGAATKQMAEMADVSEMTLFRKYGNKAELVKQAISFIVEQTDFSSAAEYTGDIQADLLRVVQAYYGSAVKHGFFFAALFSDFSRYPELLEALDQPLEIFTTIGELIARYQEEGVLKSGNPIHIVSSLLGPLVYSSMLGRAILKSNIPHRDLSNHVSMFLAGYGNNPNTIR